MSASKPAREKWNAEHYAQINISVDKKLAAEFKSACAGRGVSIAGVVKSFMTAYSCSEGKLSESLPQKKRSSRGARRREVSAIVKELEDILSEEESYFENIPENLANSVRAEEAEGSISMLSEAIEILLEAY